MNLATRIVVAVLLLIATLSVIWDTAALHEGSPTLSDATRSLNYASGGLIAWGLLALWLHLFANLWN